MTFCLETTQMHQHCLWGDHLHSLSVIKKLASPAGGFKAKLNRCWHACLGRWWYLIGDPACSCLSLCSKRKAKKSCREMVLACVAKSLEWCHCVGKPCGKLLMLHKVDHLACGAPLGFRCFRLLMPTDNGTLPKAAC